MPLLRLTAACLLALQPAPGLEPRPMIAEPLGLKLHLPAGAVAAAEPAEEGVTYTVRNAEGTWTMRIAAVVPAVEDPTVEAVLEERLDAVRTAGRPFRVLRNEPRVAGGAAGRQVFVEQELDERRSLVNGWVVLPTSPGSFVVLSLLTTAEVFAGLEPVLEASLDTIELRSRRQMLDERAAQLERGRVVVAGLTPARLREAIAPQRWYRIFRPGGAGRDTEVGFLSIQCREAMRGELTPERSRRDFGAMEAETGLMVLIEARAVIDAAAQQYVDVDGRYWMSWDRNREAWSTRQTTRLGEMERTTAETGIRELANLDIINSSREKFTREPSRWTVSDPAYLSQPELFVLGTLLPRDGSIGGPMRFLYYEAKRRRLTERIDRWAPAGDGRGTWTLTTLPLLEVAEIVQRYDAQGRRLERIDGDGTITRLIDPAELQRLWRSKGLLAR